MAGTFPGLPLSQNFDINGNPLGGCLLYVYAGGTTTPASVFQDIGLTLSAAWPLQADASGRLPLFFVADGNYHLRLTDANGVVVLDAPIVPSIGPSSTGSSGGAVDPTTVFATGDVKWQPIEGQLTGWVRCNGRTLGSQTSGASELAASSAQSLFIWLWTNFPDSVCPVIGGRGASALADWNANKQITLHDWRGYVLGGIDDMGSTAAGRWSNAPFTRGNATTAAALLGENGHTLNINEVPIHTHGVSVTLPNASVSGAPSILAQPSVSFSGAPALIGSPSFSSQTATLNLPTATLNLPSASFSGNAVTPTASNSYTPGTIASNQTNVAQALGSNGVQSGANFNAVNVATTTQSTISLNIPSYTPTINAITPSGSVSLSGGSVTLSGGSVTMSGGAAGTGTLGVTLGTLAATLVGGTLGAGNLAVTLSGGSWATTSAGSGFVHNIAQSTVLGTWFMKL